MKRCAFVVLCLGLLCVPAVAAEKPGTYIDPKLAAADPDFAIQGEYAGTVGDDKFGVQIIALGGGKFHGVGHRGGLPGEGWDEQERIEGDGERAADGSVTMTGRDGNKAVIKDGVIGIVNENGDRVAELKRVERKSQTLGAKPPEGAKVLFDGKTNDFKPGKTEGDLLVQGQTSQMKFQSVTLHVEFLLPFMPAARGQGRGNSGVYLQGRYECQVLDSFGLSGENNECGGIYQIAKPRVNMCLPPLVCANSTPSSRAWCPPPRALSRWCRVRTSASSPRAASTCARSVSRVPCSSPSDSTAPSSAASAAV